MPAAYSIQCPSCGASFLGTQSLATSITTCPHCAFNAELQSFQRDGTSSIGSAAPVTQRRRELQSPATFQPELFPLPGSEQTSSPAPHAGGDISPPAPALPAQPPRDRPQSPMVAFQRSGAADGLLSPHLPVNPVARPHPRSAWKIAFACLAGLAALAAAGYLIWENVISDSDHSQLETVTATIATPVIENPDPAPAPPPVPPVPVAAPVALEPDEAAVRKDGPVVFQQVLADPSQRSLLIHRSAKLRADAEAFFARSSGITAGMIEHVPVAPVDLLSRQPVTLLRGTTSLNPERGALLRFHSGPNDSLLLDWPLFEETHDSSLAAFAASESATRSRWFTVGIRRNHGLELTAEMRDSHYVFDLQAAPNSHLGLNGLVLRDLAVGRYLNKQTEWRVTYLARLLMLPRTDASGQRYLEIVDCEGLGLNRSVTSPAEPVKTQPEQASPSPPK